MSVSGFSDRPAPCLLRRRPHSQRQETFKRFHPLLKLPWIVRVPIVYNPYTVVLLRPGSFAAEFRSSRRSHGSQALATRTWDEVLYRVQLKEDRCSLRTYLYPVVCYGASTLCTTKGSLHCTVLRHIKLPRTRTVESNYLPLSLYCGCCY